MAEKVETSSAVAKVFNAYELLEQILARLANEDRHTAIKQRIRYLRRFYRIRRVNSTFHGVILRSNAVRFLMFTRPISNHVNIPYGVLEGNGDTEKAQKIHDLNPLAFRFGWVIPQVLRSALTGPDKDENGKTLFNAYITHKPFTAADMIALESEGLTWRQMVLSRRSARFSFQVMIQTEGLSYTHHADYSFELEEGATLGDFADQLIERYGRHRKD